MRRGQAHGQRFVDDEHSKSILAGAGTVDACRLVLRPPAGHTAPISNARAREQQQ